MSSQSKRTTTDAQIKSLLQDIFKRHSFSQTEKSVALAAFVDSLEKAAWACTKDYSRQELERIVIDARKDIESDGCVSSLLYDTVDKWHKKLKLEATKEKPFSGTVGDGKIKLEFQNYSRGYWHGMSGHSNMPHERLRLVMYKELLQIIKEFKDQVEMRGNGEIIIYPRLPPGILRDIAEDAELAKRFPCTAKLWKLANDHGYSLSINVYGKGGDPLLCTSWHTDSFETGDRDLFKLGGRT